MVPGETWCSTNVYRWFHDVKNICMESIVRCCCCCCKDAIPFTEFEYFYFRFCDVAMRTTASLHLYCRWKRYVQNKQKWKIERTNGCYILFVQFDSIIISSQSFQFQLDNKSKWHRRNTDKTENQCAAAKRVLCAVLRSIFSHKCG